ncbi:MAG: hypothetical protein LAT82_05545 [Nanoarchaeota archaeon]|nr:hypothetical protein [Nanoarchaeota archaeon]
MIIQILILNQVHSNPCNPSSYINNSNSNENRYCSSDNGILIENLTGTIYCSISPQTNNYYMFKSLKIINSQINFVNCEIRSFFIAQNNISIQNSNITLYNSIYETSSLETAFEDEILADSNSNLWYFEPYLFDMFIGPNDEPIIIGTQDIRRNFEIQGSIANFSNAFNYINELLYSEVFVNGRDMYYINLPTRFIDNSVNDLSSQRFQINFNISSPQIVESFIFDGTSTLSSVTQINISDNQEPRINTARFEYNANTQNQRLFFTFDKILRNLSIQIIDLNQSNLVIEDFSTSNLNQYTFNVNIFNTQSTHFQVDFYYEDFFGNFNSYSIIVTRPEILTPTIFTQGVLIYNYSYDRFSNLNATLHFRPLISTSIINELQFDIRNSNQDVLILENETQIFFNSTSSYYIPPTSSFFNPHRGIIRNSEFETNPVILQNNNSYTISTPTNQGFEYIIPTPREFIEVFNNSRITHTTSSPRYFNRLFSIEVEYQSRIDDLPINPSICNIEYNLNTPTQNITNLTYNVVSDRFEGEIFFNQYLPLEKNVIINCFNSLGLENISNSIIINHTHQPISDFIFEIIYEPINLGSGRFTTQVKELGIEISSSGSENTDPTTDNEYYVMVSRAEFNALNWNITKNVTPWINIGKNEEVTISHSDVNNNRAMRIDLENGSFFMINDSFIFRDERVGNSGISLFTMVKSCVPGGVCQIVSDSTEFFIFQDTTPPIVYEFNVREITNSENFEFRILVDDLESDMQLSELILTNSQNSTQQSILQILNYDTNTTSLFLTPLSNKASIIEGVLYNVSIRSRNNNNLEGIYTPSQTLLLDNQPSTGSSIEIVSSLNQNTTPQRFYLSNGDNIEFNITAGFDNFSSYEFNAGISHYEIIVDEQSNNCNTKISEQYRISNNISDNQNQIIELNLSQNMCNRVSLLIYDFAGNEEVVTPLDIIIDTTPPEFNTVLGGGLFIAPIDANNTKRFDRWEINNNTVLFEYIFDIFDDLSPIRELTINLYERDQSASTFNKVKEFEFNEVISTLPFTQNNYSFKDGNFYKIGIIGTNFANLSNIELNSSSTFLFLSNRAEIEPQGLFRANSNSIFYSSNFLNSGIFPISFSNLNQAPLECLISNISINYNNTLPNQCSLEQNNTILNCPTPQNLIDSLNLSSNSLFVNCFVDNADATSEQYFTNEFNIITLNETSNVDVNITSNSLTSNYLDNETIELNLEIIGDLGITTFIFEQELLNPISSFDSIVFRQRGVDLTYQELEDKKTLISDLSDLNINFVFNNSNLISQPTIEFINLNNNGLLTNYYVINFNSTIGEEELQNLFNLYIIENQHIQDRLFTQIEINLNSNISSSIELNSSLMSSKLDYNNSMITNFGLESLNSITSFIFLPKFENIYTLNLSNVIASLDYNSINDINFTFFSNFNVFSKQYIFNVSYAPRPIELNTSQNLELELNPTQFHMINISDFIIAPNNEIGFEFNISTQILNIEDSLLFVEILNSSSSNSSLFKEEIILFYLNNNSNYLNSSNITLRVEDSFNSVIQIPLLINWTQNSINQTNFNLSKIPFIEERLLNFVNNSFEININQSSYLIEEIKFKFSNESLNQKLELNESIASNLNYSYIDNIKANYNSKIFSNSTNTNLILFSNEILNELYKIYLEEEITSYEINITYYLAQNITLTNTQNITFEFDFNQNSIPDLTESIIVFEDNLINNESGQQFIQNNFNPSNTQESYFNITTPHFNNSNILISWIDNNTNQWNFAFTQILIENKTFENESLQGSRISVINFPKFENNKSISIPPLLSSSDIVYCLQDDDSNSVSSQCSGNNEYLITTCNTSISSSISCVEENGLWKILNLSFTTIESVCLESWDVGSWSSCSSGSQNRTVTATHNCGSNITKPNTIRSCTTSSGGGSSGGGGGGGSGGGSTTIVPPTLEEEEKTPITTPITPPTQNNNNNGLIIVEPNITQNDSQNQNTTTIPQEPTPPTTTPVIDEEDTNEESNNLFEFSLSNPLIIIIVVLIVIILIVSIILILKQKRSKNNSNKKATSTSYYNQNPKSQTSMNIISNSTQKSKNKLLKEKNLTSLSIVELDSLKQEIIKSLQEGKSISQICSLKEVKKEQNIREILRLSGFSNYLINLENEIKFNKHTLNTPKQIEQLLQRQWFFSYKPAENLDNYVRDLGFFITKYKMTNVFSEKELEEIFIDCVFDDLN